MLLTIERKAVTDADAEAVLRASYDLLDALDNVTVVFRPEHFAPFGSDETAIGRLVEEKLRAHFNRVAGDLPEIEAYFIKGALHYKEKLTKKFVEIHGNGHALAATAFAHAMYPGWAWQAEPENYQDPLFNLVVAPKKGVKITDFGNMWDDPRLQGLFPDFRAQTQFCMLWHEFGHGTGAAEPQTEKMMATIYRQTFADMDFLRLWADIRAVDMVLSFWVTEKMEKYGWPMVEALDSVLSRPHNEINAMTEEDIRALRFEAYNHDAALMDKVGRTIWRENEDIFESHDLASIADTTVRLRDEGAFGVSGVGAYRIASRFLSAARRLTQGMAAYNDISYATYSPSP